MIETLLRRGIGKGDEPTGRQAEKIRCETEVRRLSSRNAGDWIGSRSESRPEREVAAGVPQAGIVIEEDAAVPAEFHIVAGADQRCGRRQSVRVPREAL